MGRRRIGERVWVGPGVAVKSDSTLFFLQSCARRVRASGSGHDAWGVSRPVSRCRRGLRGLNILRTILGLLCWARTGTRRGCSAGKRRVVIVLWVLAVHCSERVKLYSLMLERMLRYCLSVAGGGVTVTRGCRSRRWVKRTIWFAKDDGVVVM